MKRPDGRDETWTTTPGEMQAIICHQLEDDGFNGDNWQELELELRREAWELELNDNELDDLLSYAWKWFRKG